MNETEVKISELEERISYLESLLVKDKKLGISPKEAAKKLGVGYESILKVLNEARIKQALNQNSDYILGVHYWLKNENASRVSFVIDFPKFEKVFKRG